MDLKRAGWNWMDFGFDFGFFAGWMDGMDSDGLNGPGWAGRRGFADRDLV